MANTSKIEQLDKDWFIKFWANYIKKNPNKVWSSQQKMLIDSQLQNTKNFPLEHYLKLIKSAG